MYPGAGGPVPGEGDIIMKVIFKDNCYYEKGYVIQHDEVVGLPLAVSLQLNRLEGMLQRARYLNAQPQYQPVPSLDGFKKESERPEYPIDIRLDTPVLDDKIEESLAICHEIKMMHEGAGFAELAKTFNDLFEFVNDDSFIEYKVPVRLDLPTVGDPLKLDEEKLIGYLREIYDVDGIVTEKGDCDGDL